MKSLPVITYTPSQLRAIHTIDHNLQIIACAGSGKTQVISRRIVEILAAQQKHGLLPANIVAFTFTDRAAAELKTRIQKLCIDETMPSSASLAVIGEPCSFMTFLMASMIVIVAALLALRTNGGSANPGDTFKALRKCWSAYFVGIHLIIKSLVLPDTKRLLNTRRWSDTI